MNIFVLDMDFKKCAEYHTDKHIIKMITEEMQLLSSVYYFTDQDELAPYRKTHINHPCAIWARQSLHNWLWLRQHALALYDEYTYRYGKAHKAGELLFDLPIPNLQVGVLTKLPQAMPDQYKSEDTVEAYRNYYNGSKRHLFSWKNREIPYWIK